MNEQAVDWSAHRSTTEEAHEDCLKQDFTTLEGCCEGCKTHEGVKGVALRSAIKKGHTDCVRFLLSGNTGDSVDLNRRDKRGVTLFTMAFSLLEVCDTDESSDVCLLLTVSGGNVDDCLSDGTTPLHIACITGRKELAEILIQHGAEINKPDRTGYTPFLKAVFWNKYDICKLLLPYGARVEYQIVRGEPITPLLLASRKGYNGLVRLLCRYGASLTARTTDFNGGMTAMLLAVCYNDRRGSRLETVRTLHELGANVDDRDDERMTALMHATRRCDTRMTELLLKLGVSVNLQDKKGRTALHWAVTNGGEDREVIVNVLVRNGMDESIRDHSGMMAGSCQIRNDEEDNAGNRTTMKKGVHDRKYDRKQIWDTVHSKDTNEVCQMEGGNTWLHYCAEHGFDDLFDKLINENNIYVNIRNDDGMTALSVAAAHGYSSAVQQLVEQYHADVSTIDEMRRTALHVAAHANKADVVRILIHCSDLDINSVDAGGNTALHCAASSLGIESFELLLEHTTSVTESRKTEAYDENGVCLGENEKQENAAKMTSCWLCSKDVCTDSAHSNPNRRFKVNHKGWTPFHCLVGADLSMVQAREREHLLAHLKRPEYAIDVHAVDNKKRNLLHVAVERNNGDIFKELDMLNPEQLDIDGLSPLHMAAEQAETHEESSRSTFGELIDVFYHAKPGRDIDHLSGIGLGGEDNESALLMCVRQGHVDNVKLLLANGSVLSRRSSKGVTVMHKLVDCGHTLKQEELYNVIVAYAVEWYCSFNDTPRDVPSKNSAHYRKLRSCAMRELVFGFIYDDMNVLQYAARKAAFNLLEILVKTSGIFVGDGHLPLTLLTPTMSHCQHCYHRCRNSARHECDFSSHNPESVLELIIDNSADEFDTVNSQCYHTGETEWEAGGETTLETSDAKLELESSAAELLDQKPFCTLVRPYWVIYQMMYYFMFFLHLIHMTLFSITVCQRYGRGECYVDTYDSSEYTGANHYTECHVLESWFWLFIIWPGVNSALDSASCIMVCYYQAANQCENMSKEATGTKKKNVISRVEFPQYRKLYLKCKWIYGTLKPYLNSWAFSFAFVVCTALWIFTLMSNVLAHWHIESSALVVIIGWLYTINFMVVLSEQLSILTDVLKTILYKDVLRISGILIFVILSSALSFHILNLRRSYLNNKAVSAWFTIYVIFFEIFGVGSEYQQISIEHDISDINIVLFRLFFVLYIFLASVILLNLLIAMMSDSYGEAVKSAKRSINIKKMEMSRNVIRLERNLPGFYPILNKLSIVLYNMFNDEEIR